MANHPEIYFHVGLGKVASTYLQYNVFPKLEGIHYIQRTKYKKSIEIIKEGKYDKYLVSREFDNQYEEEVKWFSSHFPDTKVIICFRRNDEWIASQYRRAVKNGFHWDFNVFFDLDDAENTYWKHHQVEFYPKIQQTEKYFTQKPLCLFHEELKEDPWVFFDKISKFSGTTYSKDKVSLKVKHSSYSEKQLRVLRAFCRKYKKTPPNMPANRILHWLTYRPWWAFFHLIMYAATLFPESWVPKEPLETKEYKKRIREVYQEDWDKVVAYAKANNP
jgi:hypothetical protein